MPVVLVALGSIARVYRFEILLQIVESRQRRALDIGPDDGYIYWAN